MVIAGLPRPASAPFWSRFFAGSSLSGRFFGWLRSAGVQDED